MTEKKLQGQTAIVTGGVRGIGLGIARRLVSEGCHIAIWDKDISTFDPERAGFTPVHLQSVDVSNVHSVNDAFANTIEKTGSLQILVNNAGINGPVLPVMEYPEEQWSRVIAVNLNGVFHCTKSIFCSVFYNYTFFNVSRSRTIESFINFLKTAWFSQGIFNSFLAKIVYCSKNAFIFFSFFCTCFFCFSLFILYCFLFLF